MRERSRFAAVALAAAVLLAACGSGPARTTAKAATSVHAASGAFPAVVHAANGTVTVPSRPDRIVSVSPSATQMLYGIGAGPQVVAVDEYSTMPADAPRTKLTEEESSAEDFLPFHPDLVLLGSDTGNQLSDQLATLHIPALVLPAAQSLSDEWAQFREIGLATGHLAAADAEVARLQGRLAAIVRSVHGLAKGVTYYQEISPSLYTATSKTFIGSLYSMLGMVNIADAADKTGSGYPQLSAEYLLRSNPDYVILADPVCCGQTAASFAARPGYSTLTAVREHHIIVVNDSIASQWGPNVVTFLQEIADAVRRGQEASH